MRKWIPTPEAVQLLHEGQMVLSSMSGRGVRIDKGYLEATTASTAASMRDVEAQIRNEPEFIDWRRRFGEKTNLTSPKQFVEVLTGVLGYTPTIVEDGEEKASASAVALNGIDLPIVKLYQRLQKLQKLSSTYLDGIRREMVQHTDGLFYVHPQFNLNSVVTFRSSAEQPNVQNVYKREPEFAAIVRRAYIPRPGYQFIELDYVSAEVRLAACYTEDPVAIREIKENLDAHQDAAAKLFFLEPKEVAKSVRNIAKNKWVFPQFYGDYYVSCAAALWPAVQGEKVKDSEETIPQRLAKNGIRDLEAFTEHTRKIEDWYWNKKYKKHTKWKNDWYDAYLREGGFLMKTGFAVHGVFNRNDVLNYPIQGCLQASSRVMTDAGWVPIVELVGKACKVWTGFRWADAVGVPRGRCQLATVTLSSGLTVRCDTRHKFKDEHGQWVPFESLKVGGHVALSQCPPVVPPSPDVNWWFVYGFIMGDGSLGPGEGFNITVGEVKKPDLLAIRDFLAGVGYKTDGSYRSLRWSEIPPKEKQHAVCYRLSAGYRQMTMQLQSVGFDMSWRAHTKRIPEGVWRASIQEQRDFLEGLWRSDGSRGVHQEGNLHMCNAALLRDVQVLSSMLGYDSILCETKNGYLLRFHHRRFRAMSPRKYPSAALSRQVSVVRKKNYDDVCEYITDHRGLRATPGPSQYVGERILERNGELPEVYRYDRVVSITVEDAEDVTYTMSVDDDLHQFVADGVIHKNSSFHCLLWSLVQKERLMRRARMKGFLIGEIHDCDLAEVLPSERDAYIDMSVDVMTRKIVEHWPWIIVPLGIESEACPVDGSWYDKAVLSRGEEGWHPDDLEKWEKSYGVWA